MQIIYNLKHMYQVYLKECRYTPELMRQEVKIHITLNYLLLTPTNRQSHCS